jgi:hypothetical protein
MILIDLLVCWYSGGAWDKLKGGEFEKKPVNSIWRKKWTGNAYNIINIYIRTYIIYIYN